MPNTRTMCPTTQKGHGIDDDPGIGVDKTLFRMSSKTTPMPQEQRGMAIISIGIATTEMTQPTNLHEARGTGETRSSYAEKDDVHRVMRINPDHPGQERRLTEPRPKEPPRPRWIITI